MTTTALSKRRPRGVNRKQSILQQSSGEKVASLPEYLEAHEVDALLAAAEPRARLLMLIQWRAGLRISEALALEPGDVRLNSDRPSLRVRRGKGRKAREVPVHPELENALVAVTSFGLVNEGPFVSVTRTTAWRWVQQAKQRAVEAGQLVASRKIGTHTLRHSYARHMLMHGVPLNYLSRWLEVWPESHWPGFALRQVDVLQPYSA